METWEVAQVAGSPPRLWGICLAQTTRIPRRPVHPHACGEYIGSGGVSPFSVGSPPRLWGIYQPPAPARPIGGSPPRLWGICDDRGQAVL